MITTEKSTRLRDPDVPTHFTRLDDILNKMRDFNQTLYDIAESRERHLVRLVGAFPAKQLAPVQKDSITPDGTINDIEDTLQRIETNINRIKEYDQHMLDSI